MDDAERLSGLDLDDRVHDPLDGDLVIVAEVMSGLAGDGAASTAVAGP